MAFACDICHETWPDKDNQGSYKPGGKDICPDCAEDDNPEDGQTTGGGRTKNYGGRDPRDVDDEDDGDHPWSSGSNDSKRGRGGRNHRGPIR